MYQGLRNQFLRVTQILKMVMLQQMFRLVIKTLMNSVNANQRKI